eukprot:3759231-Rhodomonas_salina.4
MVNTLCQRGARPLSPPASWFKPHCTTPVLWLCTNKHDTTERAHLPHASSTAMTAIRVQPMALTYRSVRSAVTPSWMLVLESVG